MFMHDVWFKKKNNNKKEQNIHLEQKELLKWDIFRVDDRGFGMKLNKNSIKL